MGPPRPTGLAVLYGLLVETIVNAFLVQFDQFPLAALLLPGASVVWPGCRRCVLRHCGHAES